MRFVKIAMFMLAFCLVLPLAAAGPACAEDDCDGVPDQLQIKGGEDADHDQIPDQLRISRPVAETTVLSTDCDGVPDRLQIKGGDGADHDQLPDRLRIRADQ